MKTSLSFLFALLSATSACATEKVPAITELPPTVSAGKPENACAKDPMSFCYLRNQAYSEGALVDRRECKRRQTWDVRKRDQQPLTWQQSDQETR